MGLELVSVIVREYDEAIEFFVDVLGCVVEDDSPCSTATANLRDGSLFARPAPAVASCSPSSSDEQVALIGGNSPVAWDSSCASTISCVVQAHDERGVEFLTAPRAESYGQVAVFKDLYGNKWDLLGAA